MAEPVWCAPVLPHISHKLNKTQNLTCSEAGLLFTITSPQQKMGKLVKFIADTPNIMEL
jgi:hypothetical protein